MSNGNISPRTTYPFNPPFYNSYDKRGLIGLSQVEAEKVIRKVDRNLINDMALGKRPRAIIIELEDSDTPYNRTIGMAQPEEFDERGFISATGQQVTIADPDDFFSFILGAGDQLGISIFNQLGAPLVGEALRVLVYSDELAGDDDTFKKKLFEGNALSSPFTNQYEASSGVLPSVAPYNYTQPFPLPPVGHLVGEYWKPYNGLSNVGSIWRNPLGIGPCNLETGISCAIVMHIDPLPAFEQSYLEMDFEPVYNIALDRYSNFAFQIHREWSGGSSFIMLLIAGASVFISVPDTFFDIDHEYYARFWGINPTYGELYVDGSLVAQVSSPPFPGPPPPPGPHILWDFVTSIPLGYDGVSVKRFAFCIDGAPAPLDRPLLAQSRDQSRIVIPSVSKDGTYYVRFRKTLGQVIPYGFTLTRVGGTTTAYGSMGAGGATGAIANYSTVTQQRAITLIRLLKSWEPLFKQNNLQVGIRFFSSVPSALITGLTRKFIYALAQIDSVRSIWLDVPVILDEGQLG
jgi:hypothetical protein